MANQETVLTASQAAELLVQKRAQEGIPEASEEEAPEQEVAAEEGVESEEEVQQVELEDGSEGEPTDQEDVDEEPVLYAVKVDGKEHQVPLEDLLESYSTRSAQQKRFRELAEERKKYEAEMAEVQSAKERYFSNAGVLEEMRQQLSAVEISEPPAELAQTDPLEYQRLALEAMRQREQQRTHLETVERQQQELVQAQAEEFDNYKRAQAKQFLERYPQYEDREKFADLQTGVRGMLHEYGFNDQEVATIVDARLGSVMTDLYELKSKTKAGAKKVKSKPPKVIRGSDTVRKPQVSGPSRDLKQKAERFEKIASQPGHRDDAARAAADFLIAQRQQRR